MQSLKKALLISISLLIGFQVKVSLAADYVVDVAVIGGLLATNTNNRAGIASTVVASGLVLASIKASKLEAKLAHKSSQLNVSGFDRRGGASKDTTVDNDIKNHSQTAVYLSCQKTPWLFKPGDEWQASAVDSACKQ